jgi:fatty-acyl-CoA synthase
VRPAYGLAEATVAVTLADGVSDLAAMEINGSAIVSSGRPLDGVEVRIDRPQGSGPDEIGEILVRGPSVTGRLIGGTLRKDADGWLRTNDQGTMRDGELIVVARGDDVVLVGGRKIYMEDVDAAASDVTGVRRGCAIGVPEPGNGAFHIVLEPDDDDGDQEVLVRDVRLAVSRAVNVLPTAVHVAQRGEVLKTSSGKPRRAATDDAVGLTRG